MKVCILTSSRAEYGLLRKLILSLKKDKFFHLNLIVTGSHLSRKHGFSISEIIKDKIQINKKIYLNTKNSNSSTVNKNFSIINSEMGYYFEKKNIDLFLVLGDRYEVLAGVISSYIQGIPVVHLHGGEKTLDSLDDSFRHSISKFSKLHLVAHEAFRKRLIQLGETKKSIHVVGGFGAYAISKTKYLTKRELQNKLKIVFKDNIIIINFYPEINNLKNSKKKLELILKILKNFKNYSLIFTLPSHDIGNNIFEKLIRNFVKENKNSKVYENLGHENYLSLIKISSLVIGNSSSGILETPSFNKFSINIGKRQEGRVFSKLVININENLFKLEKTIKSLIKKKRNNIINNRNNLYFKKNTVENTIKILKKLKIKKLKKIKDFRDIKFYEH